MKKIPEPFPSIVLKVLDFETGEDPIVILDKLIGEMEEPAKRGDRKKVITAARSVRRKIARVQDLCINQLKDTKSD